jgi:hypothetical protein
VFALSFSLGNSDTIKSMQKSVVDAAALDDLLDTMDINDISEDVTGIMDHQVNRQ